MESTARLPDFVPESLRKYRYVRWTALLGGGFGAMGTLSSICFPISGPLGIGVLSASALALCGLVFINLPENPVKTIRYGPYKLTVNFAKGVYAFGRDELMNANVLIRVQTVQTLIKTLLDGHPTDEFDRRLRDAGKAVGLSFASALLPRDNDYRQLEENVKRWIEFDRHAGFARIDHEAEWPAPWAKIARDRVIEITFLVQNSFLNEGTAPPHCSFFSGYIEAVLQFILQDFKSEIAVTPCRAANTERHHVCQYEATVKLRA